MAAKKTTKKTAKKIPARKATVKKAGSTKAAASKGAAAKKPAKKSDLKTQPTAASVDAFINKVPNETRRRDAKAVLAMMQRVTGEKPKMWGPSIVGFGEHHYKYESGREGDMCMIGFSPRSSATVLYVMPGFEEQQPLLARLGKHKTGGSCLYVTKLEDVDAKVLEAIAAKAWAHMRKKHNA